MEIRFIYLFAILSFLSIVSCSKDDVELPIPTMTNIEVGLGNNERGVIGRDLHFNAEILAGDKIDLVQIKLEPKDGETNAGSWSFEITWDEFKGVKNSTVHKHFDIPEDAIDYSKTIIWDIFTHTGIEVAQDIGNVDFDTEDYPDFLIGAEFDNNELTPSPISDLKAWEEGDYYLGFLYENTTYNMSNYHYTEVTSM